MTSPDNVIVTSRDLYFALRRMQAANLADMIQCAASPAVAGVPFNIWIGPNRELHDVTSSDPADLFRWEDGGWHNPDEYPRRAGKPPQAPRVVTETIELPVADLGGKHLVKFSDAVEVLTKASFQSLTRRVTHLRQAGHYKAWVCAMEASKVFGVNLGLACAQMAAKVKEKRRPTFRRHQSRSWKPKFTVGKVEVGWKHGKPAYHFPPGRPPLSLEAAMERYRQKLAKKRKGNKPGKSRGGPKFLECKVIPRETVPFRAKAKKGMPQIASGLVSRDQQIELAKKLIEKAVDGALDQVKEVAGDYIKTQVQKWTEKGLAMGDALLRFASQND